jgi:hypothetical protein
MRCQDIERLMLEVGDRELTGKEKDLLERHLARCAACASFGGFLGELEFIGQDVQGPALPSELEKRVRLACHEELGSRVQGRKRRSRSVPSAGVPWAIWAALAALIILTLCFLIPGIEAFRQEQKITLEGVLALLLVFQNALMLFFTPVIMRRRRFSGPASGHWT